LKSPQYVSRPSGALGGSAALLIVWENLWKVLHDEPPLDLSQGYNAHVAHYSPAEACRLGVTGH
jgi:hypothetical protein